VVLVVVMVIAKYATEKVGFILLYFPGETKKKTCHRCGGSGICRGCGGSGWITEK